jgi:class 3 adenylate cyclase
MMAAVCVNCHNGHPQSTKHDWKVGDVRGIQEITIDQPVITGLGSFRYLPAYFLLLAVSGAGFIVMQRRQAVAMALLNDKLHEGNRFLSAVSAKVSKYLAPQIYLRIFSGQSDAVVRTERKKLTIFFSDIMDFTSTTESTQPEHLTALLNEYFTEMSEIALKHGGTIDKFIGDAILIFFGDPESKGEQEDARACLSMAIEMQARLAQLNAQWKERGVQKPFRVRMGINTGYCNVGNFGSDQRMDYTIIGAEANLAARLQSAAEPGRIVLSYETYALVRDRVSAHALDEIRMKGIIDSAQ